MNENVIKVTGKLVFRINVYIRFCDIYVIISITYSLLALPRKHHEEVGRMVFQKKKEC